mmetsp:Transcript_16978/g.41037  ORF Transcript_16978/g.41037 Transcript_16978/m.41037 type:complete len:235 (+) Transcript_16978:613-1317(+)
MCSRTSMSTSLGCFATWEALTARPTSKSEEKWKAAARHAATKTSTMPSFAHRRSRLGVHRCGDSSQTRCSPSRRSAWRAANGQTSSASTQKASSCRLFRSSSRTPTPRRWNSCVSHPRTSLRSSTSRNALLLRGSLSSLLDSLHPKTASSRPPSCASASASTICATSSCSSTRGWTAWRTCCGNSCAPPSERSYRRATLQPFADSTTGSFSATKPSPSPSRTPSAGPRSTAPRV